MSHQTGPRTPEGKARSSQSNRRHGLSTANIIVHPDQQSMFDEMEAELRNEVQPDGPLETHAFQRLITAAWQLEQCRKQEGSLVVLEPTTENKAHLEKVHRYYLRWEGSYNSAFRQIRLLQTDRAVKMVSEGAPSEPFPPLTDFPKIEQFARRNAKPVTFDDHVRQQLNTQLAIITLEKQIREQGGVPITGKLYAEAARQAPPNLTESTTCETKSPQPQVGRNSPCPCGSGNKYKRCCGVNAPPILNQAA